jgi:hypothetical protein
LKKPTKKQDLKTLEEAKVSFTGRSKVFTGRSKTFTGRSKAKLN